MARGTVAFFGHMQLVRPVHLRREPADHGGDRGGHRLRHLPLRPLPEARGQGPGSEDAYYEMFHGTSHVILGSGLTIAGAMFCLHFTRLPMFQSMGIPLAVGMVVSGEGGLDASAPRLWWWPVTSA